MKILAVDTTSDICSVAILENDETIDEINLNNGKTHSENLLPIIDEILKKNKINLSEIDLISCCTGPGSFTGIRIGIAVIKAFAEVNNIPIVSVTSLETLARNDNSNLTKVVLIDARNNQVYSGVFNKNYEMIENYNADDIEVIINDLKKYEEVVCIGNGAILHKDKLKENLQNVKFIEENKQCAACGGKIAFKKYKEENLQTADTLLPVYLRKSQAERMKKGK